MRLFKKKAEPASLEQALEPRPVQTDMERLVLLPKRVLVSMIFDERALRVATGVELAAERNEVKRVDKLRARYLGIARELGYGRGHQSGA